MYFIEIHLGGKIYRLSNSSSITVLFQRDKMVFYFGLNPFSGNHKSIIFYFQRNAFLFHSSQRQKDNELLGRFINIIRDMWRLIEGHNRINKE